MTRGNYSQSVYLIHSVYLLGFKKPGFFFYTYLLLSRYICGYTNYLKFVGLPLEKKLKIAFEEMTLARTP